MDRRLPRLGLHLHCRYPRVSSSTAVKMTTFFVWLCCLPALLLLLQTRGEASVPNLASPRLRLRPRSPYLFPTTIAEPTRFFQVTQPIQTPPFVTPCSQLLLNHSFANTISLPPYIAPYHPSPECGIDWQKVILKWRATCKGRQFDRISAVWLSGVEVFRTCTAEPTRDGVVWEVEKDVTRFASVFKEQQTLVVSLANVVDQTYTGIFYVTLTVDFYAKTGHPGDSAPPRHADMVLPVAMASPFNGGYWFQLQGAEDIRSVPLKLPSNVYQATLQICVSFHGDDEFWYTNPSNDYIAANNLTDQPGNGPFREVVARIDDFIAGIVWPFPVVYTGGINPLFWRPVAAIGAFDLPTYDFDVTPFLGVFGDGGSHNISLRVTNSLPFWLLDANLHLWLDPAIADVKAHLLEYRAPDLNFRSENVYSGVDGNLSTNAVRSIYFSGRVDSSFGNITTSSSHAYRFRNLQIYTHNASASRIDQDIHTKSRVSLKIGSDLNQMEYNRSFPLTLNSAQINLPNNTIILNSSISHAFNEDLGLSGIDSSSSLQNFQAADGSIAISGNLVTSGWGALSQNYSFQSTGDCYYRSVSARNYSILSDHVVDSCILTDAEAGLHAST